MAKAPDRPAAARPPRCRPLVSASLALGLIVASLPGEAPARTHHRQPTRAAEPARPAPQGPNPTPSEPATPSGQTETDARDAAGRAQAAAAEEQRLATLRVAAAAKLRDTETDLAARATEVSVLASRRAAAEARLIAHATAIAPLLPLMQRLALFPAETLLAVPGPPEQTLRGLAVLRGMARQMEREAAGLREEQAALADQADALAAALPGLRAIQAEQAAQAQGLDSQIATAQALRRQAEAIGAGTAEAGTAEAARRVAAEAGRADTLRTAVTALEAARARAEAEAADEAARADRLRQAAAAGEARRRQESLARPPGAGLEPKGALLAPVAGAIVRGWGEQTEAGPANGVSYRSPPQARVVAPCAGRVRFAGPFRSYGALLILDCGGGYAFVLAGLDRLDVTVGGMVLAGEPVGAMPGWDATSDAARPALYMELRHDGQAVNPAPFLRGRL